MPAPFGDYALGPAYDEMFRANGRPRTHYRNLYTQLLSLPSEELYRFKKEADLSSDEAWARFLENDQQAERLQAQQQLQQQ
jgi:uncharacterized circularly permuted ATP-grasp superfamily protein